MHHFVFPHALVLHGYALVAGLMLILWIVSLLIKNAGIVDIGWALGLVLLAWLYVTKGGGYPLRSSFILVMVAIWGLRLSHLLVMRLLRDPHEDNRYQRIRLAWKTHLELKFLALFQIEALLDVILAIPFLLIAINPKPHLGLIEMSGIFVWVIGLIGEVVADEQLKGFKKDPQNKGKTCSAGLWNYSRHPNYFFEWLMWVGYFIFAVGSPWGWVSFICPLIMLHMLINVSGVPLAEAQSLVSKGEEYRRYQQSTSMFIPWLKGQVKHG